MDIGARGVQHEVVAFRSVIIIGERVG